MIDEIIFLVVLGLVCIGFVAGLIGFVGKKITDLFIR